jgi:GNAT superfamily N-acetyltransferase
MHPSDAAPLHAAFANTPWGERGLPFYQNLALAHASGERVVWIGLLDDVPAGFGSLVWQSGYPAFAARNVPEIQDLNVVPTLRRRGVATAILDVAEHEAFERSTTVGIGFGLHPGYRAAQRLYILRGYVPDGRGIYDGSHYPEEGDTVRLDDNLALYLEKPHPT